MNSPISSSESAQALSAKTPPACPSRRPQVFHLELLWQDTLIDLIRLRPGARQNIELPDGSFAYIQTPKLKDLAQNAFILEQKSRKTELPFNVEVAFQNGYSLQAKSVSQELNNPTFSLSESGFLHTLMVVCAAQVCLVSALAIVPEKTPDPHAGGGIASEQLQRYIRISSSKAPKKDAQSAVASHGRSLEKAEQVSLPKGKTQARRTRRRQKQKPVRLGAFIDALQEEVSGIQFGKTTERLGEAIQSAAQSQALGSGLGGILTPKEILSAGVGNGDLGTGSSRTEQPVRKTLAALKRIQDLAPRKKRPALQAAAEPSKAPQNQAAEEEMDPLIREHLSKQMRRHRNAVRYCYETWGLTANPVKSGRITLELTLHPDGEITHIHADTEQADLEGVRRCVEKMASDWYLGDGLVKSPQRLSFPFILRPHPDEK